MQRSIAGILAVFNVINGLAMLFAGSMAIDGDKIAAIYIVRNPDKLRHAPHAS